jgi:hypothetical protein
MNVITRQNVENGITVFQLDINKEDLEPPQRTMFPDCFNFAHFELIYPNERI